MNDPSFETWPSGDEWPELLDMAVNSTREARLQLRIGDSLRCVAGHFPGNPVVPGVALIHWAITGARICFPGVQAFRGMPRVKFTNPLIPPVEVRLEFHHDPERRQTRFEYSVRDGSCASGQVSWS